MHDAYTVIHVPNVYVDVYYIILLHMHIRQWRKEGLQIYVNIVDVGCILLTKMISVNIHVLVSGEPCQLRPWHWPIEDF